MPALSVAETYHEATKYTAAGLQGGGHRLDFSKQPAPFKRYPQAPCLELAARLPDGDELESDGALAAWRDAQDVEREKGLASVSHWLFFTAGVTGVVPYAETPLLLRAAPSAGGLYPTEVYLVARAHAGLEDGLYHYGPEGHELARLFRGDAMARLTAACFEHPALAAADLALVFTGVFERSAWRYQDRAYRRVLLDTGHVWGNAALYAPLIGRTAHPVGGFDDAALAELLFLDPAEEGALLVLAAAPGAEAASAGPTALAGPWTPARPMKEGTQLAALHQAGAMRAPAEPAPARPAAGLPRFGAAAPLPAPEPLMSDRLGPTILRRRSCREYSGEGFGPGELSTCLAFAEAGAPRLAPELLKTYVVVHDVAGLEPGCYAYEPEAHALRQTRFMPLRKEAKHLALGQSLAGDAAAMVVHTVDLAEAVRRYGDRAYRYVHLDAGFLGERLNLAAVRQGLGASGIGGFFDDEVNGLLGLPEREAVVYLTTLGVPMRPRKG